MYMYMYIATMMRLSYTHTHAHTYTHTHAHIHTHTHAYTHTHIHIVEKAGGKCLPCVVDIRDESQVEKAVKQAVDKFGGIDIVVNNASAIHLTGTVETPMKRYIDRATGYTVLYV